MSNLTKTNNGLLFFDDFSEKTLMWTLSPSDANCLSFGDDGLQIKHTRRYVTYTLVEPSMDEYSCIVKLDHIPFNEKDIAGIIVMSTTKEYAECQSYLATGPSSIGNSQDINIDIENIIKDILEDKYVQWEEDSVDDSIEAATLLSESPIVRTNSDFVDITYQYIKFTKNKYKYIFYASTDGSVWIEIGNVKFDNSGVIGFFLYGVEDNQEIIDNTHCFFKSFAVYNSKYITIEGVDRKYEMEIFDENGLVLIRTDNIQHSFLISRSNKQCIINTTTMPTPIRNGKIRIYSKSNYQVTIDEFELGEETYGGDGFTLERDIRLFIDNKEIEQDKIYDLGTFYRNSYFIKLDVRNNEEYPLSDIKIKVIKYSEYYGGEEEIAVAVHSDNIPPKDLLYDKQVIIGVINPSEGRSIYLKLLDKPVQDFYMTANSYRFKIIIE